MYDTHMYIGLHTLRLYQEISSTCIRTCYLVEYLSTASDPVKIKQKLLPSRNMAARKTPWSPAVEIVM